MTLQGADVMTRVDDDAHHIRATKGSRWTLCKQKAAELNTLPADTMVWPDGNAACWTCWDERRAAVQREEPAR